MEQFRLKGNAFKAVKRKWILGYYPVTLLGSAALILRFLTRLDRDWFSWPLFTGLMVLAAAFFAWAVYEKLQAERVACDDFVLTINDDTITREKFGADTITIGFNEITRIYTASDGSLIIMRS